MASNNAETEARDIASEIALKEHQLIQPASFLPVRGDELAPFGGAEISLPKTLAELGESVNRSYDMSTTAAVDAQIPVAGSGSAGFGRRVIILERAAFNKVERPTATGTEKHYGYAIRLCITVNRWETTTKVSLPFLAASAQIGTIEAQWVLQVIGLTGAAIDAAIVPPTELNVDTFVIAKQSLEKLISAIRDPSTRFEAKLIAEIRPPDVLNEELRGAIGRSYALTCLERGRSLSEAQERLGTSHVAVQDAMKAIYAEVGGLTNPLEKPTKEVRRQAAELCGSIRADIPRW